MNKSEKEKNVISREALWEPYVRDANSFYNQILTVATAFLGGSLLFIDKIVDNFVLATLPLLSIGWFYLLKCIITLTTVRRNNLEAARCALIHKKLEKQLFSLVGDSEYLMAHLEIKADPIRIEIADIETKLKSVTEKNETQTDSFVRFLIIGLIFVTLFGFINILITSWDSQYGSKEQKEVIMDDKKNKKHLPSDEIKKLVNSGDDTQTHSIDYLQTIDEVGINVIEPPPDPPDEIPIEQDPDTEK